MSFDKSDAEAIAGKLNARIVRKTNHDIAQFWHHDQLIGFFGIRRGSNTSHDYIPKQIFLSPKQCRDFRICTMTLEEVIELLKEKNIIPTDS